ncbi:MAG: TonB-dependent receptor [Alkalispirochaeta sp.]
MVSLFSLFRSNAQRPALRLLSTVLLVAGCAPAVLWAQTAPEGDPGDEPIEVIVTADRLDTAVSAVPALVSVITAEEIQASGATSVVELLERHTGVSFASYSNEAQAQVDMRGFGTGSVGRVLVLVDGRRINSPDLSGVNWPSIPIDSVARIEVVHGSAAAQYGNHAVAGVINIITTTAEAPLEVRATGSVGSNSANQQRVGLGHAAPWGTLSASAERFSTDGHRDRSAYSTLGFDLKTETMIGSALQLTLAGRYAEVDYELPGALAEAEYESDPFQASNPADEARVSRLGGALTAEWQVAPTVTAELVTDYAFTGTENDTASFPSFTSRDLHTIAASPAITAEWGIGAIPVRSRIGVDWSRARQESTSFDSVERDTVDDESALTQDTIGTVLSSTFYLTEALDVDLAVRYDRSTIGAEKESAGIDEDTMHQAVVFDAGAALRPTETVKLYLAGGTLFRYPAIDEQADLNFADQFESDLDPERGFTVEAGGSIATGRRGEISLGAYWLEMRDEIQYVTDPVTFQGANENIGATRRLGLDVSAQIHPIDLIGFTAGYSFVRATFADGEHEGKMVPLVPSHSVNGELTLNPIPAVTIGQRATYRGDAYQGGDSANTEALVAGVFTTDVFVRVEPNRMVEAFPGELSITAEITNLADVTYAPVQFHYGATSYYPAPGREWRVAASYRY